MARARNIKPGFFKNEELAECQPFARLCFAGLWTMADREGRLEDRPKRIKGELFAYDSVEVEPLLCELERFGFITRYTADGVALIQILAFAKHQNPHHREVASSLPAMPGYVPPKAKPEAQDGSHDTEALGQPEASPSIDPPTCDLEGGSSRADSGSLIPDTGFQREEASSRKIPACPHGLLRNMYHEVLPELPAAKTMGLKRKEVLSKFWKFIFTEPRNDGTPRAATAEEAIKWTREYFERARSNDFCMNLTPRSAEHPNWKSNLDYLLSESGRIQVIEKTEEVSA